MAGRVPAQEQLCMAQEIERRFLLGDIPYSVLSGARTAPVMQGYLKLQTDAVLRIRKLGDRYFLTSKSGQGLVREEREEEITEPVFKLLWPFTAGARLEKLRYTYPLGERTGEIDVYSGDLTGLVIMEVEFPDELAAEAFRPPDYCGPEITEDSRYSNTSLALHGLPTTP